MIRKVSETAAGSGAAAAAADKGAEALHTAADRAARERDAAAFVAAEVARVGPRGPDGVQRATFGALVRDSRLASPPGGGSPRVAPKEGRRGSAHDEGWPTVAPIIRSR